jgi:hypothetical protein
MGSSGLHIQWPASAALLFNADIFIIIVIRL